MPGWHVVQAVQLPSLAPAVKKPAAHAAHVLSVVALPAPVTYCPARHVVLAAQSVALLPSASQVAPPQASFVAAPPAQ